MTLLLLIFLIGIIAKVYHDTKRIKVNHVHLHTEKLPPGKSIHILQLSDLHGKTFGKHHERLFQKMEELNPDIVVITGDMIDRKTNQLQPSLQLAEKIVTYHAKTYYVSGNHEREHELQDEFFHGLAERGIHMLDNSNQLIDVKDTSFQLIGLADAATSHNDIEQALTDIDDSLLTVLLSHAPDIWKEQYPEEVDVILSGHTHGGQIRLPFIGALVAPDQGYFPKYDKGIFALSKRQMLYIDSGLGTSWIDVRFFNQSQISMITIENKHTIVKKV